MGKNKGYVAKDETIKLPKKIEILNEIEELTKIEGDYKYHTSKDCYFKDVQVYGTHSTSLIFSIETKTHNLPEPQQKKLLTYFESLGKIKDDSDVLMNL